MVMMTLLLLLLLFLMFYHIIFHCHPLIAMMIVILKEKIGFKNFFLQIKLKKKLMQLLQEKKTARKLTKLLRVLENLSKLFPKADEIFGK